MSLFQYSILNKYLSGQDQAKIDKAYKKFCKYFFDSRIQRNIRASKEEQFQEGFLRELFVNILGYTINPTPNFNITTEFKNQKGAKKADGAILVNNHAIGVIELKSTKTKDLESIRQQAFDYKANQSECVYVITSNFEKLRFYINNAVDYEEFDLFHLSPDSFKLLYMCLAKENLLKNIPLDMKEASILREEQISKKFYADYSLFKRNLYRDMVKNNRNNNQLREFADKHFKKTLFMKSQKLLDRFLFIFFAEDRGLLPPNMISKINEEWKGLKKSRVNQSLYDRYKLYFTDLNEGNKDEDIFQYNGGLFLEDPILDSLLLDDDLLFKHTSKLSEYNFDSEIDVNILGHIFENSLNEIESVNAEIDGVEFDKQKAKRKKDGVFYTPNYITKYIVDNTIGRLCKEKKDKLGIIEEEYRIGRHKKTKENLLTLLDEYRKWLLQLTICDPACGSGAFLNQALDFLINEHKIIDELSASLLGHTMLLSDIENTILENNIFGVDINEESVEIAKLSLWLRTAQNGRKLTTLNNNIKCGNSLIKSKAIAGDKAFNWQKEFPDVFLKGGFDIVIGNPPYLRVQGLRENFEKESIFYEENYKSATGRFDVYVLFMEKSFFLIKESGKISFILPHKFMVSDFGEGIRKFLVDNRGIEELIHLGHEMVFQDASTYTCIINLSRYNDLIRFKKLKLANILNHSEYQIAEYNSLSEEKWLLKSKREMDLFKKLKKLPLTVKDVFENISQGIVSVGDDIFLIKGKVQGDKFIGYSNKATSNITIEADLVKPLLKGEDIKKYCNLEHKYYVFYPHFEKDGKTFPLEENTFKEKYPLAYNYILPYKDELIAKKIRYKTNPKSWYSLHRSREMSLFEQKKIVTPETSLGCNMTIDSSCLYHNTQVYSFIPKKEYKEDIKYLICLLNSNLFWWYLASTGAVLRGGYFRFKTKFLEPFPLPKLKASEEKRLFIDKVDIVLNKTEQLSKISTRLEKFLANKFSLEKLSQKLKAWYKLDFGEFIHELNKAIKKYGGIKLSKSEEFEWMDIFEEQKIKVNQIQDEINKMDREINLMVYELYELTDEEIAIIEEAVK